MSDRENKLSKVSLYRAKDMVGNLSEVNFASYERVAEDSENGLKFALFFLNKVFPPPLWYDFFKENLDLSPKTKRPEIKHSGFILLINTDSSTYACAGGLGYHELIKQIDIESRFGINVAKKILSQQELKGLAQKDASGIVNSLDRFFRAQYNPTGDIDNLHRVLTSIRGRTDKTKAIYKEIGSSVRAGDSLSVTGGKDFSQLLDFIKKVDELYNSPIKNSLDIPELEPISEKYDKVLIRNLWLQLANDICSVKDIDKALFLDNIEVGFLPDLAEEYEVMFNRKISKATSYEDVFSIVKGILDKEVEVGNDIKRLEVLQNIKLSIRFLDQDSFTPKKQLIHYICGDIVYLDEVYFLNAKSWYRANEDFKEKIDKELDEIRCLPPEALSLNSWNLGNDEDKYNKSHSNLICLDKHLVRIRRERGGIEFCDLLNEKNGEYNLIHVKHACGAALRALFAQGHVSAQLFSDSDEFKDNVINCRNGLDGKFDGSQKKIIKGLLKKRKNEITIVYAIYDDSVSHKVKNNENLRVTELFKGTISLFAKVDLLSRVQSLRSLGYNVALTRIKPYPED